MGQARSSSSSPDYYLSFFPEGMEEELWLSPYFPDEEAEAQGHTAVRRQAVGRPAGLNEQRACQGFGGRLFGTRVPPLEARGRVPRAYSSAAQELQVLGKLSVLLIQLRKLRQLLPPLGCLSCEVGMMRPLRVSQRKG